MYLLCGTWYFSSYYSQNWSYLDIVILEDSPTIAERVCSLHCILHSICIHTMYMYHAACTCTCTCTLTYIEQGTCTCMYSHLIILADFILQFFAGWTGFWSNNKPTKTLYAEYSQFRLSRWCYWKVHIPLHVHVRVQIVCVHVHVCVCYIVHIHVHVCVSMHIHVVHV